MSSGCERDKTMNPKPKRRAVLWDMDGTLVDSEPLHLAVTANLLNAEGLSAPPGIEHALIGRSIKACHDFLVLEVGLRLDLTKFVSIRNALYVREAYGLRIRKGALAAVDAAAASGAVQAVVSNSDRAIVDASLGAIGFECNAFLSVSRNDVGRGKPSPDSYLLAAKLLDVDRADCIVIEDSPTGAEAGLAAGMKVIAWPEQGFVRAVFGPDVLFLDYDPSGTSLTELLTQLL